MSWLGAEYAGVNLSFLSLIIFIAIIASFTQLVEMVVEKVCSGPVCFSGYLFAADRCKLCYPGWISVYAIKEHFLMWELLLYTV